jgi:hypothetical protein
MASKELNQVPSDAISNEDIVRELKEILKSELFKSSGKLSQLLEYVCNKKIIGHGDQLNEYLIGVEVFERKPDFSAAEDAIVRVRAHDLRRRLKEYYDTEGKEHPLQIILPKGRYCPDFSQVKPRIPQIGSTHPVVSEPFLVESLPQAGSPQTSKNFFSRWWAIAFAAIFVISLGANITNIWIWTSSPKTEKLGLTTVTETFSFYDELLGPLDRRTPRMTQINLSNPQVMFSFYRHSPSAASYLGRAAQPIDPKLGRQLPLNANDSGVPFISREPMYYFLHTTDDEYTGMGEAACAFHLARLFQLLNRPLQLSQARFLNWERASKENIIVLGQPLINRWAEKNLSEPNFSYLSTRYMNRHPEPEEQPFYQCEVENRPASSGFVDYGLILMQSLPNGNRILTLSGACSYGTLGTGEFFCNPEKMRPVHQALKARSAGKGIPPNYEVLIKILIKEDIPVETTFVACRVGRSGR